MYVYAWGGQVVHVSSGVSGGQKRVSEPSGLTYRCKSRRHSELLSHLSSPIVTFHILNPLVFISQCPFEF